jgi:phosphoglycolate phosphatase-like HAD superfamily hydrolase
MQTIVFDLDGTLLDSRKRHVVVLQNAILQAGIDVSGLSFDDFISYKANGNTTKAYLAEGCHFSQDISKKIMTEWQRQIELPENLKNDVLYYDTVPTLENLRGRFHLVLLTARQNKQAMLKGINELKIDKYFNEIVCVNPYKAKIEKILWLRNIENAILCVGDTEVDYYAAKENGINFYALNRGFRSKNYWDSKNVISFESLNLMPF